MDVWDHFLYREKEAKGLSLGVEKFPECCEEEEGSDGMRGTFFCHVRFDDNAYMRVHERIEIEGTVARRRSYAYFLIVDGEEIRGWEYDTTHPQAYHGHGRNHERIPCGEVSFRETVEASWAMIHDVRESCDDTS